MKAATTLVLLLATPVFLIPSSQAASSVEYVTSVGARVPAAYVVSGDKVIIPLPHGTPEVIVDAAWLESIVSDVALAGGTFSLDREDSKRVLVVAPEPEARALVFQPFVLGSMPLFSWGSEESIRLERPMYMHLLNEDVPPIQPMDVDMSPGSVVVDFSGPDHSGQTVSWNATWLTRYHIFAPWFVHETEGTLDFTYDGKHFQVEAPHFTSIAATGIDVDYTSATAADIKWSVTWTSSCLTTQRSTWVTHGTTSSYGLTTYGSSTGGTGYKVSLTNLPDDTFYYYKIYAYCEDAAGTPYPANSAASEMIGVGVKSAVDDDYAAVKSDWQTRVINNMESAGNYFYRTFRVDLYNAYLHTTPWNNLLPRESRYDQDEYLTNMQNGVAWPSIDNGADLLVVHTDVDLGRYENGVWKEAYAVAEKGTSAWVDASAAEWLADEFDYGRWLVQHEVSHNFDADDKSGDPSCTVMDAYDMPGGNCGTLGATGWDSTNVGLMNPNRLGVGDRDDAH